MIFPKHWNMKFAYRNRGFRCKEHYVDTVGKNTKAITEYIADQLKRDKEGRPIKHIRPTEPVYRSPVINASWQAFQDDLQHFLKGL